MDRDTASSLLGETKRFKTQIRYIRIPLPLFLPSRASLYEPKTAQLGLTSLHQIPF